MTGYNLPPGCRESDIPGNRSIDAAWDAFYDSELEHLWEAFLDGLEDSERQVELRRKYPTADEAYDNYERFKSYVDAEFESVYKGGR